MIILAWNKPYYIRQLKWLLETLCEKNLQLPELQFYINDIARCISIVVILAARIQDHQFNNIIKCYTFLKVDYL